MWRSVAGTYAGRLWDLPPLCIAHCIIAHRRVGYRPSETISHGPIRLAPKAYGRRLRSVAVTCSHSIIPFVWLGVRTAIT
jgi:hypothetical protein